MQRAIPLIVLLVGGMCLAQQSPSFKLEEHVLNSGGTPSEGAELTSASFSVRLASIGDAVMAGGLSGASFEMDTGFVAAYRPPGEVAPALRFTDSQTLVWPAELSAGVYNLYRDDTSDGFGNCEEENLSAPTRIDSAVPTNGATFFYLVTVTNRLAEEGTKGFQSNATERRGAVGLPPCP
jgi:hypothetical protein